MNLFTRLFGQPSGGAREMDYVGAQRMVLDYARYLECSAPMPGQIVDAARLPHAKAMLRDALLFCIGNSSDPRLEEHLQAGSLRLSAFQSGVGEPGRGHDFASLDLNQDALDVAHQLETEEESCGDWRAVATRELEQLRQELYELELEVAQSGRLTA